MQRSQTDTGVRHAVIAGEQICGTKPPEITGVQRLPNSLTVQYSELMQNCIQPESDGSNLAFQSKSINGKRCTLAAELRPHVAVVR